MALKLAIVGALPRTQRDIAMAARIGEVRLSKIVNGVETATDDEQKALAKALHCSRASLFPEREAVAS